MDFLTPAPRPHPLCQFSGVFSRPDSGGVSQAAPQGVRNLCITQTSQSNGWPHVLFKEMSIIFSLFEIKNVFTVENTGKFETESP